MKTCKRVAAHRRHQIIGGAMSNKNQANTKTWMIMKPLRGLVSKVVLFWSSSSTTSPGMPSQGCPHPHSRRLKDSKPSSLQSNTAWAWCNHPSTKTSTTPSTRIQSIIWTWRKGLYWSNSPQRWHPLHPMLKVPWTLSRPKWHLKAKKGQWRYHLDRDLHLPN